MLLAIDVGNTHTVIGLFINRKIKQHWRLPTDRHTTLDQMILTMKGLIDIENLELKDLDGFCFCSVVPEVSQILSSLGEKISAKTLNVDDIKTKIIKIDYDHPETVGADRIANAVAAKELFKTPAVVVDFGTATTFDVISEEGVYLGGAISPGVETSIEGLLQKAAQLYDIRLEKASKVIGSNTKESLSAGFIIGLASLTDSLLAKINDEIGQEAMVVGTGGFSELLAPYCKKINEVDVFLTLKGLEIIYRKQNLCNRF